MPRYRVEPHQGERSFSENGQGEGPMLESIETTYSEGGGKVFFYSGYSAREMALNHQKGEGGTIYVNSVSRKIVRKDFNLATNAPVYYAVASGAVFTLIRKDNNVVRAYWPTIDE